MITKIDRKAERARRHARGSTKVSGTTECPRLEISKSNKNIMAQSVSCIVDKAIKEGRN